MGRRAETTEYLKECIADATIKLMRKKPLEKITIQEITQEAGVGRVTYFRYFTSKTDVLTYKLSNLWDSWGEKHPFPVEESDYNQALWFFSFCYSIRTTLLLLYKNEQQDALLRAYLNYTSPILEEDNREKKGNYLHKYMAYGMLGVVNEWASGKFEDSPEELARLCTSP